MNRHEHLYRKTGRVLLALLGMWLAAILLVVATPSKLWKAGLPSLILFDGVAPLLLLAVLPPVFAKMRISPTLPTSMPGVDNTPTQIRSVYLTRKDDSR